MSSKKIGIICDTFKVNKFKKELDDNKFEYETKPHAGNLTIISVCTTEEFFNATQKKVHAICLKVEAHFKRSN